MARELVQLEVSRPLTKFLLILTLVLTTLWAFFAFRWYLGNTLAEYFNTQLNDVEMAQLAVSLAPTDPLTHWRLGQVYQKKLPIDQQKLVISEFQTAVNLSPNDYRLWTALGTAFEQIGDSTQAEKALRQAVTLAPSYAYPHWYLGNLFLRDGRYDEAFEELRVASDADPELRPQLFNLAYQLQGTDLQRMKRTVGSSDPVQADFAVFLFGMKRFDDGLAVWNSLSDQQKREHRLEGSKIITLLLGAKEFHRALDVWNGLAPESLQVTSGQIEDGSLEDAVAHGSEMIFGWQMSSTPQMQIAIDSNRSHSGSRSLRMNFRARNKLDSINVFQLVPVEASRQYDFECYVKTEKLQTASAPKVQVVDATTGALLAASGESPTGDSDWTRVAFTFKTGDKTEAVTVRFSRDSCGGDECPIFGSVWYDDFSIKRSD